jgi:hypothetical protein
MRRSTAVVLTLVGLPVGAVALANLPQDEMRRNLYPDRGACERDYSAQQCQPNSGSGSGHGGGGYHGPYYYANRSAAAVSSDPGTGRTGQVTRTETSMRGGFGSFGRALGATG